MLAGNRRLGRFGLGATLVMWALVVVTALTALLWHQALLWFTVGGGWVSWIVLTLIQVLCFGYIVLWVVLTFDTLRLVRLVRTKDYAKIAIPLVAVLVLGLCGSATASAANIVGSSRTAISTLFGSGGPSLPPSDGYYNVLLLGADSGLGRDSMRYDSISVVSVNAETGKTTIFGIPRDMPHVPFAPGPMHDLYPNGLQAHDDETCGWGGAGSTSSPTPWRPATPDRPSIRTRRSMDPVPPSRRPKMRPRAYWASRSRTTCSST